MSYVILDLEWNSAYSYKLKHFVNEIIEFGAVRLDDELNIESTYSSLVKHKIGRKLNGKVKQLTKISITELKQDGVSFLDAAESFADFLGDSTVLTWGTSDIHALIENYSFFTGDYHIPFLTSYCDLQEYCERALDRYDEGNQMGLGACAELLGVSFSEEEQHRAFADAYLSLKCLKAVAGSAPLENSVLKADCEDFYERMTFKNHFITDINDPEVDKSQLKFSCDRCGSPMRRVKKWRLHNKSFSSDFSCKSCGRKFTGRVAFKKRYEGVKVTRKIVEIVPKKKKAVPVAEQETVRTD